MPVSLVLASDDVDWMGHVIVQQSEIEDLPPLCQGASRETAFFIDGVERDACIQGYWGSPRIAKYRDGDKFGYGLAAAFSVQFSYLKISTLKDPVYLPHSNALLTVHNNNDVVVYYNFLSGLTTSEDGRTISFRGNPTLLARFGNSKARPVLQASENGEWVVFGSKEYGYGVINASEPNKPRQAVWRDKKSDGDATLPVVGISNDGKSLVTYDTQNGFYAYKIDNCTTPIVNMRLSSDGGNCRQSLDSVGLIIDGVDSPREGELIEAGWKFMFYGYSNQKLIQVVVTSRRASSMFYTVPYIGLGDSYTSGEGETDDLLYLYSTNQPHERCHLSTRSYPYLTGHAWMIMPQSVACSGAVIDDILGTKNYIGQGGRLGSAGLGYSEQEIHQKQQEALSEVIPGRLPQIEFVRHYKPLVATVGIGGNDVGLVGKLQSCLTLSTCEWAKPGEMRAKVEKEVSEQYSRYLSLFTALQSAAPGVTVLAVGYPMPVSTGESCQSIISPLLNRDERIFMNEVIHLLNQTMYRAAINTGTRYVDLESVYGENVLCNQTNTPAMNAIRAGDDIAVLGVNVIGAESFHPTPYGHELASRRILQSFPVFPYGVARCVSACVMSDEWLRRSDYWRAGISGKSASKIVHLSGFISPTIDADALTPISVGPGVFLPGSSVRIELHSDIRHLGDLTVAIDGSVTGRIKIPSDITGRHTIFIIGTTVTGEQIELYTEVEIGRPHVDILSKAENPIGLSAEILGDTYTPTSTKTNTNLAIASEANKIRYTPVAILIAGAVAVVLIVVAVLYNRHSHNKRV